MNEVLTEARFNNADLGFFLANYAAAKRQFVTTIFLSHLSVFFSLAIFKYHKNAATEFMKVASVLLASLNVCRIMTGLLLYCMLIALTFDDRTKPLVKTA